MKAAKMLLPQQPFRIEILLGQLAESWGRRGRQAQPYVDGLAIL
jgi:hypothetical protein